MSTKKLQIIGSLGGQSNSYIVNIITNEDDTYSIDDSFNWDEMITAYESGAQVVCRCQTYADEVDETDFRDIVYYLNDFDANDNAAYFSKSSDGEIITIGISSSGDVLYVKTISCIVDDKLELSGRPADAKAVGDEFAGVSKTLNDLHQEIDYRENVGNRVAIIDSNADDEHYPTAKAVYDALETKQPVGDYALKSEIPSVPVQSVNGRTGIVELTAQDVGAMPYDVEIPSIAGLATERYVDAKSYMIDLVLNGDGSYSIDGSFNWNEMVSAIEASAYVACKCVNDGIIELYQLTHYDGDTVYFGSTANGFLVETFCITRDGAVVFSWKHINVDSTLAYEGLPADAKAVGNKFVAHDKDAAAHMDIRELVGKKLDATADVQYSVSKAVKNFNSVCVIEETGADVSAADNSAHFDKTHLVVQKDTYKLDRDTMLSLQDKKLVGNGSVAWKDWDNIAQGWKDTFDPTMLSGALKVRYADDPVYLSMKLPSEANFAADTVTRPGMRASDYAAANLVTVNNIGAIMPIDYTQLPDEVVICIGNLSLYTLSKEPNAKWQLHDKCTVPEGYAMYSIPWSTSHDARVSIDPSKVSVCDGYMRFILTRDDFAPMSGVAGSLAKTLHFWGNHNKLDLMNNAAVITFCEVWVETPEAAGNLYVAPGCDRKSADSSIISQNFWGRNVLLSMEKAVIAGHNISDALYEKLRDTPNDTRLVYADYASVHSTDYDLKLFQEKIENDLADKGVKMEACFSTLEITEVEKTGININPGIYETGYIAQAGTDYDGYHNQSFRTKGYIKVEAGRTIALYYDKAEWNSNDNGKAFEIVEYDINKTLLGQRQYFKSYANSNSTFTLSADTAYIRITYNNWSAFTTPVSDIKAAIYYIEDARKEFVAYYADMEAVYGVKGNRVILTAPNGAQFSLSVQDDGTLLAKPCLI